MKQNKKALVVLLLAAAGVWGYVIYKVYDTYFNKEESLSVVPDQKPPEVAQQLPDSFTILASYRDPFLGSTEPVRTKTAPSPQSMKKKKEPPPPLPWPPVSYSGIIKNQQSRQQLALLTVAGESNLLRPGEVFREVTVLTIYNDSVELGFGGERRVVRK